MRASEGETSAGITLPDFPWDRLIPIRATAREHPDGLCDLSVGTPVDPVPIAIQEALASAADAPGYPTTHGTGELRTAIAGWLSRKLGVVGVDPQAVLSNRNQGANCRSAESARSATWSVCSDP